MTTRLTVIIAAVAGIICATPAGAEEVGVGVGPVGVTVGSGHRDWAATTIEIEIGRLS